MEKQKRWQFYLILFVIALTLFNISHTLFYYGRDLQRPLGQEDAAGIAKSSLERLENLEADSKTWIESFAKHIGSPVSDITPHPEAPGIFVVTFKDVKDKQNFDRYLPEAGVRIPFVPAQLSLAHLPGENPKSSFVASPLTTRLGEENLDYFTFLPKRNAQGEITEEFKGYVFERAGSIKSTLDQDTRLGTSVFHLLSGNESSQENEEHLLQIAEEALEVERNLPEKISKKYWQSLFSWTGAKPAQELAVLKAKTSALAEKIAKNAQDPSAVKKSRGLEFLQQKTLEDFLGLLTKREKEITAPSLYTKRAPIASASASTTQYQLPLDHPFFSSLNIDLERNALELQLAPELQEMFLGDRVVSSDKKSSDEIAKRLILKELARLNRQTEEAFRFNGKGYFASLFSIENPTGAVLFNLKDAGNKSSGELLKWIQSSWSRESVDLKDNSYHLVSKDEFSKAPEVEKSFSLFTWAPTDDAVAPFRSGSLYVVLNGFQSLENKYNSSPNTEEALLFKKDIQNLAMLLKAQGFIAYPGSFITDDPQFSKSLIFERDDANAPLLKATRENFEAKGNKKWAALAVSNVQERLAKVNQVEDEIQRELLKERDEFRAAQADLNLKNRLLVPPPIKNPFWENFKLSFRKFFRGDEHKVLKWGLDLSGGKSVRIALYDHNQHLVTDPDQLKQAVNELYERINKLGVAERTIRIENDTILLDFPGAQGLSATDLVQASSMTFHIVNEQFSRMNPSLRSQVEEFLQGVWNEAVVNNKKTPSDIQEIAWRHLGAGEEHFASDAARTLYESGLRLANPEQSAPSPDFDEKLSKVAMMRGDTLADWEGAANPLVIVFNNFALEGSSLAGVQVTYDPMEGNVLTFQVANRYENKNYSASRDPRDDFFNWTSQFSEDKIAGTAREGFSQGRGWRMAVVLNNTIISKPVLRAAIRDSASISGRFTQREATELAADLKAGSLTFTPKILSEENVSPELGAQERAQGLLASFIALSLVFVTMVGCYRFGGFIASIAVLFNILIIWGVLQSLGAALTLPGIAGIVLTIGMAVDANVLVFERIKEELKSSKRLLPAIQMGYKKAFSAIFDSNLTTVIAAIILIQFDSGPIKGFAVTLAVGIASSMFTALFMTRYFFVHWAEKAQQEGKSLNFRSFLTDTNYDFLGKTKKAFGISLLCICIGAYFFAETRNTIFGMDFTGGYSLTVDLEPNAQDTSYRKRAEEALVKAGASSSDIHVRELSQATRLRIFLGESMNEKGRPFYNLPEKIDATGRYTFEQNPRIDWVVQALEKGGLKIENSQLPSLEKYWSVVSGQFSDKMRFNASIGLVFALLCILIYVTFRFEWKFALGAVIALAHDLALTLGIIALFNRLGFPVQIDLQTVGALMTIVGYSLNDTIIIFDRIREDSKTHRRWSYPQLINHSLNVTLSRTLMTSGTTLLVLMALVLFGGPSIFGFAFVMTVGVLVGTFSSLFIACPIMLYFHNRELIGKQEWQRTV